MAHRVTLSLTEQAYDILLRAGNGSAYVSQMLVARWRSLHHAMACLSEAIDGSTVRELVHYLNGLFDLPQASQMLLAHPRIKKAALTERQVHCVLLLAEEYWGGNAYVRRAIDATVGAPASCSSTTVPPETP
jgi:hypothetical protein